jgi:hypothetical protein
MYTLYFNAVNNHSFNRIETKVRPYIGDKTRLKATYEKRIDLDDYDRKNGYVDVIITNIEIDFEDNSFDIDVRLLNEL